LRIVGHEFDDPGERSKLGVDPGFTPCVKVLVARLTRSPGNASINQEFRGVGRGNVALLCHGSGGDNASAAR
jgi:hypothetical protein